MTTFFRTVEIRISVELNARVCASPVCVFILYLPQGGIYIPLWK